MAAMGKSSGGTGSLALLVTVSSTTVNLTSLGGTDYAVYSAGGATPDTRKSGGGSIITATCAGAPSPYGSDPRTISWADGTPTASGSSTNGTYYGAFGSTYGWTVTFPADTTTRTANIYCGVYQDTMKVLASLSDSSAAPGTDTTTLTDLSAHTAGVISVTYKAASSGQTLTIQFGETIGTGGNTALNAAWAS